VEDRDRLGEKNLLGPSSQKALPGRIGDSIDFSLRTSGGGLGHLTGPTAAAGPVHVMKGYQITFLYRMSLKGSHMPSYCFHYTYGNVSWNDGIGHPFQGSVPKMDIGSTHLAVDTGEQNLSLL